jgi:predicted AlkP superfamily pyrophosphatase or phosphodiesterase
MRSTDPHWWSGEPIWQTSAKNGVPAAVYFWPGSDKPIHGQLPQWWLPFDGSVPYSVRVDGLLAWIEVYHPKLLLGYFEMVDHAGHSYGPSNTPKILEALHQADATLGRLIEGLEKLGLWEDVTLILVSDHGMADVGNGRTAGDERIAYLEDYMDEASGLLHEIVWMDCSPVTAIFPSSDQEEAVRQALAAVPPQIGRVYAADDPFIALDRHYNRHDSIAPILFVLNEGWLFRVHRPRARLVEPENHPPLNDNEGEDPHAWELRGTIPNSNSNSNSNSNYEEEEERAAGAWCPTINGGTHGYDWTVPAMWPMFAAKGPRLKSGATLDVIANTDLYLLLCELLDLTVRNEAHHGQADTVARLWR